MSDAMVFFSPPHLMARRSNKLYLKRNIYSVFSFQSAHSKCEESHYLKNDRCCKKCEPGDALKHSNTSDLYLTPESAQSRFAIYSTTRHKNTFPFTKILTRRGRKFKNGTARLKMCPHCARSYSASYLATHRAPES